MYDNFDRDTRHAVLKHYRAEANPRPGARRQADALRPHDVPALVVWGGRDPYLGVDLAETAEAGFSQRARRGAPRQRALAFHRQP